MNKPMEDFFNIEKEKLLYRGQPMQDSLYISYATNLLRSTIDISGLNKFDPEFVKLSQVGFNIIGTTLKMLSCREELGKAAKV